MIDQFNNVTDTWVYDYGAGAPGPLLNHTHTDFLTFNNNLDYTVRKFLSSPHLLSLPTRQSVYNASEVEKARTTYEYDNYAPDPSHVHAALEPREAISGLCDTQNCPGDPNFTDPNYSTRGNVTSATQYLFNGSGSITGSIPRYR